MRQISHLPRLLGVLNYELESRTSAFPKTCKYLSCIKIHRQSKIDRTDEADLQWPPPPLSRPLLKQGGTSDGVTEASPGDSDWGRSSRRESCQCNRNSSLEFVACVRAATNQNHANRRRLAIVWERRLLMTRRQSLPRSDDGATYLEKALNIAIVSISVVVWIV